MSESLVSETVSFNLFAVCGTGNSGFVVVWDDGHTVRARRFGRTGLSIGEEFAVSPPDQDITEDHVLPSAVAAIGIPAGFWVSWVSASPPARLMMRRFTQDGIARGAAVQVNQEEINPQRQPDMACVRGSNTVVTWIGADQSVRARIFDDSGNAVGEEFPISADGIHEGPVRALQLEGAGFIVTWLGQPFGLGSEMLVSAIAADGIILLGQTILDRGVSHDVFGAAAFLEERDAARSGRFAVVRSIPASPDITLEARIFDTHNDGNPSKQAVDSQNITTPADPASQEEPAIASDAFAASAPNAMINIVWTQQDADGESPPRRIRHRRIASDGSLTDPTFISGTDGGNQFSPVASAFSTDEGQILLAVAWLDDTTREGGPNRVALKVRVLD
jgi:hypothetical protein